MTRTKHGGYEPAPRENVRSLIDLVNSNLTEEQLLRAVRLILPSQNYSDWLAGREAARRA